MTSTWGKQIKILCSLAVVFAVALVPAAGIGNSSAQAAETAQRAPGDSDCIELWQTFADFLSGVSTLATTNNIGPDSDWGISAGDLGGWVSDYTSIAVDMVGNPDAYAEIAPKYADIISNAWQSTETVATHSIPGGQTIIEYPAYAQYYEMQSGPLLTLNTLQHMEELLGGQTKLAPELTEQMRTGYFDTFPRQASGEGYLDISGSYSELWQESLAANITIAQIVPDIDGDDNPDVLVHAITHDLTTWEIASQVIAKRGHDAAHLWEEPEGGVEEGCLTFALPAGDLNGDGLADVIAYVLEIDLDTWEIASEVITKKGNSGTHLWQGESNELIWIAASRDGYEYDLNCDGRNDLLIGISTEMHAITVAPTGEPTDEGGGAKDVFATEEDVYCTGSGFPPNTDVDVYIVGDLAWTDGMVIPPDVSSDGMNTVPTDAAGDITPTEVWPAPLTPGEYDMVFDANRNGIYDVGIDVVDNPAHPGFVVTGAPPPRVPALSQPGIIAIITLFAGLMVWTVRRRRLAS